MASKKVGIDRAVEYQEKLEKFRALFEAAHNSKRSGMGISLEKIEIETGRKFDKVYVNTGNQRLGRYMVDRNSWAIYGIKSWAQVNDRRWYGTLDTADQWNWEPYYGSPLPGSAVEKELANREKEIQDNYRQRGRPRKSV